MANIDTDETFLSMTIVTGVGDGMILHSLIDRQWPVGKFSHFTCKETVTYFCLVVLGFFLTFCLSHLRFMQHVKILIQLGEIAMTVMS